MDFVEFWESACLFPAMACKSCLSAVKCVVEILQFMRQKFISIGNDMISSAIWNK